jgi:hypothetical protein
MTAKKTKARTAHDTPQSEAGTTPARPTEPTPEFQERFLAALRRTVYVETAAELAGVDAATLRRWLAHGRRQPNGPFGAFLLAVNKALADQEVEILEAVQSAGSEDWRALAWLLERRFPRRWAENRELWEPEDDRFGDGEDDL